MTAAHKMVTRLPPAGHVSMYVAVSACVGSLAGGFGPLVAGIVLESLREMAWHVGSFTFVAFHVLFAASAVLRLASTRLIPRLTEPAPRVIGRSA